MSRRGFTLIEVLVVSGVIASLVAILLPSLSSARKQARRVACLSQMRQIGIGTGMYTQANQDFFPRSSHSALAFNCKPWGYALPPYLSRMHYTGPGSGWEQFFNGLYRCPQDKRRDRWSYGKNVWFELGPEETGEVFGLAAGPIFPRTSSVPKPGATVMYGELTSKSMGDHVMAHFWYLGGSPEVDAKRHERVCNFTFVDTHAESFQFESTFSLAKKIDRWRPGKPR